MTSTGAPKRQPLITTQTTNERHTERDGGLETEGQRQRVRDRQRAKQVVAYLRAYNWPSPNVLGRYIIPFAHSTSHLVCLMRFGNILQYTSRATTTPATSYSHILSSTDAQRLAALATNVGVIDVPDRGLKLSCEPTTVDYLKVS